MEKSLSIQTKTKKIIRLINAGWTWEQVAEELQLTVGYLQKLAKNSYSRASNYNKLLAKARANKELSIETTIEKRSASKVAIVTETGYMIQRDCSVLQRQDSEVFIPDFCIYELRKISRDTEEAKNALELIMNHNFNTISLEADLLYEEPHGIELFKRRSIGVVALCCNLHAKGYRVELYAYSREVVELAFLQNAGFIIH